MNPRDDDHARAFTACRLANGTAIIARVIVVYNLGDFPADALTTYGIETQHSDEFIARPSRYIRGAPRPRSSKDVSIEMTQASISMPAYSIERGDS